MKTLWLEIFQKHGNTVIINRGYEQEAVQEELKLLMGTENVSSGENADADFTIIIGKTE